MGILAIRRLAVPHRHSLSKLILHPPSFPVPHPSSLFCIVCCDAIATPNKKSQHAQHHTQHPQKARILCDKALHRLSHSGVPAMDATHLLGQPHPREAQPGGYLPCVHHRKQHHRGYRTAGRPLPESQRPTDHRREALRSFGHRIEIQSAGEGLGTRICPRETSFNTCRLVQEAIVAQVVFRTLRCRTC